MELPKILWREQDSLHLVSEERRRLRVVLLTTDSSRMLLALRENHCNVVALITPMAFRPGRLTRLKRLRIQLQQAFAAPTALEAAAAEWLVPVVRTWSLEDPACLRSLESMKPDVLVVAGFPEILSERVLRIPKLGALNLHASLLPRYRGAQPIAQVLLRGEPFTGVTIHFMDRGVDTGDIVAQDVVPILETDKVSTLAGRIFELGSRILIDVLERLALGRLERRPQDHRRASSFKRLGADAGLVDWTAPAEAVARLLRLSPWLEVYTFFGRHKLVLLAAHVRTETEPPTSIETGTQEPVDGHRSRAVEALESRRAKAHQSKKAETLESKEADAPGPHATEPAEDRSPGRVLYREGRGLVVLCGAGRLVLDDWRLEGWWPVRSWAGRGLGPGSVLGRPERRPPER